MNTYRWLVRREFWENRAMWLIPAVFSACVVVAVLFGHVEAMDAPFQLVGGMALLTVGVAFYALLGIYVGWYLLDCLYADRRDKSVLFWKSLPISDAETVLSKLAMAFLVVPLVYFVFADGTALLTAFIVSVRAHSLVGNELWNPRVWLQLQVLWIYLIFTSALWYLPVAGYLLLISASAKRAVMLWSLLPPLALSVLERWLFGTYWVGHELGVRFAGQLSASFRAEPWMQRNSDELKELPNIVAMIDLKGFLTNPETLIGIVAGVLLIAAAIQVRARRAEI